MGIPIPRIYDWSAEASNPVGAEYILEEKATGQALGSVWGKLPMDAQLDIVNQIVDMEKKFASISFPKHGCIYYESDLKSRSFDYERLDYDSSSNSQLPGFVIGPSTSPKFWEGGKAKMNLDRGPCTLLRCNIILLANVGLGNSVADYAAAVGKNELEWATSHARPRMNFHRSMESPETPDDYISLLKHYMILAPYLAAGSIIEQPNRILHPDLHLDNIFFDPGTNRITCIIDWQLASVCPISLHRSYPQMLELSVTSQSDQCTQEKKLLDHYYAAVKKADPLRWKVLNEPFLPVRTDPISLVPGCWNREDLFSLRNALITVVARWNDIGHGEKGEKPCPVNFGEEELLQHQNEMDLLEGISTIVYQLQDEGLIPLGGMVRQEQYERAMELNNHFKHEFIDLAENKRQQELHAKVWPYQ